MRLLIELVYQEPDDPSEDDGENGRMIAVEVALANMAVVCLPEVINRTGWLTTGIPGKGQGPPVSLMDDLLEVILQDPEFVSEARSRVAACKADGLDQEQWEEEFLEALVDWEAPRTYGDPRFIIPPYLMGMWRAFLEHTYWKPIAGHFWNERAGDSPET
jgi:hypothetical protein